MSGQSKGSDVKGIPFGYEWVLKAKGWKKGEREGASVVYPKRGNEVILISTSKHLDVIRNE
ncbi:hypothetical protein [Guptibacillus algicola]|uniref:hypothetical protein n=1 Tax=Guptibacillus algicola TaxID=225844 RepID=UPI001CD392F7|nr:hypothetical protein [Alkalihalobacillus algicola]MCA0987425.1 hypothetical protein [Alkalihalobacillus algicola]